MAYRIMAQGWDIGNRIYLKLKECWIEDLNF